MEFIYAAGVDETYGTYFDDECFDIHDDDDHDTDNDTDDEIDNGTHDDTDDDGRENLLSNHASRIKDIARARMSILEELWT